MKDYLEFEKPLKDLQDRIDRLTKSKSQKESVQRLLRLHLARRTQLEQEIYGSLTPWQRTQMARHPERPSLTDYIKFLCQNFIELHGDRTFGDDPSIVGGFAQFQGRSICILGHQKGKSLKDRMRRNFGMSAPEGYRKALRLMKLAEKFGLPILTFIDTPGAYPGVHAEERGQAEAIARNLFVMSHLRVPILAVITGEGGSGGALALGVADRVLMLEHSIYSVISPEGCAAILWGNSTAAPQAAEALKMTGADLLKLGIIDEIIPEPMGGAHRDPESTSEELRKSILFHLTETENIPAETLVISRYQKFRGMAALGVQE